MRSSFSSASINRSLVLRTSKPRLESDVDVIARIDKDSVQIERKIMLRSDRPVNEIKLTLPAGEEFNAILSKPVGSELPMISISNAATLTPVQQEAAHHAECHQPAGFLATGGHAQQRQRL
jgi:hypothetical protein